MIREFKQYFQPGVLVPPCTASTLGGWVRKVTFPGVQDQPKKHLVFKNKIKKRKISLQISCNSSEMKSSDISATKTTGTANTAFWECCLHSRWEEMLNVTQRLRRAKMCFSATPPQGAHLTGSPFVHLGMTRGWNQTENSPCPEKPACLGKQGPPRASPEEGHVQL